MATTEVPETVVCPNCNHNVVIKLYQVDISINSSQGHFHTIHHRREPAYTVYCINCGHFITNDPTGRPPKSDKGAKPDARDGATAKPRRTAPSTTAAAKDPGRAPARKKRAK